MALGSTEGSSSSQMLPNKVGSGPSLALNGVPPPALPPRALGICWCCKSHFDLVTMILSQLWNFSGLSFCRAVFALPAAGFAPLSLLGTAKQLSPSSPNISVAAPHFAHPLTGMDVVEPFCAPALRVPLSSCLPSPLHSTENGSLLFG